MKHGDLIGDLMPRDEHSPEMPVYKIFKYSYDPATQTATLPENAQVLRIDHVDDGFYKGDFVWAIVKVGDPCVLRHVETPFPPPNVPVISVELRVKERQFVEVPGTPVKAGEHDGKIYIDCTPDGVRQVEIAVFKTGQEITIPLEQLSYIGLNRLWIVQELGLYTFLVTP